MYLQLENSNETRPNVLLIWATLVYLWQQTDCKWQRKRSTHHESEVTFVNGGKRESDVTETSVSSIEPLLLRSLNQSHIKISYRTRLWIAQKHCSLFVWHDEKGNWTVWVFSSPKQPDTEFFSSAEKHVGVKFTACLQVAPGLIMGEGNLSTPYVPITCTRSNLPYFLPPPYCNSIL